MARALSRRIFLTASAGAIIGTSGCLGGEQDPYIPGGSIQFDNETEKDVTAHLTVQHKALSQGELIDYERQNTDPSIIENHSPPRELDVEAQANSTTVVKNVIESRGMYYVHARIDSGQRADWWYWFDENHFLSLWLEGAELQLSESGNYD